MPVPEPGHAVKDMAKTRMPMPVFDRLSRTPFPNFTDLFKRKPIAITPPLSEPDGCAPASRKDNDAAMLARAQLGRPLDGDVDSRDERGET
jgi:hypothetical protein